MSQRTSLHFFKEKVFVNSTDVYWLNVCSEKFNSTQKENIFGYREVNVKVTEINRQRSTKDSPYIRSQGSKKTYVETFSCDDWRSSTQVKLPRSTTRCEVSNWDKMRVYSVGVSLISSHKMTEVNSATNSLVEKNGDIKLSTTVAKSLGLEY